MRSRAVGVRKQRAADYKEEPKERWSETSMAPHTGTGNQSTNDGKGNHEQRLGLRQDTGGDRDGR